MCAVAVWQKARAACWIRPWRVARRCLPAMLQGKEVRFGYAWSLVWSIVCGCVPGFWLSTKGASTSSPLSLLVQTTKHQTCPSVWHGAAPLACAARSAQATRASGSLRHGDRSSFDFRAARRYEALITFNTWSMLMMFWYNCCTYLYKLWINHTHQPCFPPQAEPYL